MNINRLVADLVVVAHFTYVAFVVFGLVAIVIGLAMKKPWARNFWFRVIHLTMIGIVVLEAWIGMTCPLTTLENWLRTGGPPATDAPGFIERWLHAVMFFRLPAWAFSVVYSGFGLIVLATWIVESPRLPWSGKKMNRDGSKTDTRISP